MVVVILWAVLVPRLDHVVVVILGLGETYRVIYVSTNALYQAPMKWTALAEFI